MIGLLAMHRLRQHLPGGIQHGRRGLIAGAFDTQHKANRLIFHLSLKRQQ